MTVRIRLLGGFEVAVDGVPVPPDAWTRRHAAALVKLLALRPAPAAPRAGHRRLWPGLAVDVAGPRLHKAAHYARRALGHDDGVLAAQRDWSRWLPDDACGSTSTSSSGSGAEAVAAADARARGAGAGPVRRAAAARRPLRAVGRGGPRRRPGAARRPAAAGRAVGGAAAEDPADEQAHLALVRASAGRGDVRGALRQLERLDQALRRELGTAPEPRGAAAARPGWSGGLPESRPPERSTGDPAVRPPGRRRRGARADGPGRRRAGARRCWSPARPASARPRCSTWPSALARQRGWRTGRGTASAVEGPWPYAPVLEALSDLCRRHPALLDGLDEAFRAELERACPAATSAGAASPATSGCSSRPPSWSGSRPPGTGCCSSSTTCTRPTRRRCGCCTTCPGARWRSPS